MSAQTDSYFGLSEAEGPEGQLKVIEWVNADPFSFEVIKEDGFAVITGVLQGCSDSIIEFSDYGEETLWVNLRNAIEFAKVPKVAHILTEFGFQFSANRESSEDGVQRLLLSARYPDFGDRSVIERGKWAFEAWGADEIRYIDQVEGWAQRQIRFSNSGDPQYTPHDWLAHGLLWEAVLATEDLSDFSEAIAQKSQRLQAETADASTRMQGFRSRRYFGAEMDVYFGLGASSIGRHVVQGYAELSNPYALAERSRNIQMLLRTLFTHNINNTAYGSIYEDLANDVEVTDEMIRAWAEGFVKLATEPEE